MPNAGNLAGVSTGTRKTTSHSPFLLDLNFTISLAGGGTTQPTIATSPNTTWNTNLDLPPAARCAKAVELEEIDDRA